MTATLSLTPAPSMLSASAWRRLRTGTTAALLLVATTAAIGLAAQAPAISPVATPPSTTTTVAPQAPVTPLVDLSATPHAHHGGHR